MPPPHAPTPEHVPSPGERRGVAGLVLGLLLLSLVPLAAGLATTPDDRVFLGLIGPYGNDQAFYVGWGPRQALDGHLLFEDKYNGADVRRLVVHPLWLAIGWTSRWTGLPLLVVNQLQRLIAAAFVLVLVHRHLLWLLDRSRWRLLALGLVAFSSGFGLVAERWGWRTPDLWVVESNVFLSLLWETNLPAATALFLWALLEGRRTFFSGPRRPVRLGLVTLALGTVYPYGVLSVWFVLAVVGFARLLVAPEASEARTVGSLVRDWLLVIAISGPIVAWDAFLVLTDPRLTVGQAHYGSPGPVAYAAGFGLLSLLAPVGVWIARRRRDMRLLFPAAWALATFVQIYWPLALVPFQLQLILGVQVPLAALSAVALRAGWERLVRSAPALRRLAVPAAVVLVALSAATNVDHYRRLFLQLGEHRLPDSMSADLHRGLRWLAGAGDGRQVALAAPPIAPYVPVVASNRMVSADYEAPTADFDAKLAELRALGEADASPEDWRRFLRRHRVEWVIWDPAMSELLGEASRLRLESLPEVEAAWSEGDVAILGVGP